MDATVSNTAATKQDAARQQSLTLAALGIVFGDIGTSPLYTMHQPFTNPEGSFGIGGLGLTLDEPDVLGVLSLIFWSLIIIVSLKYCWLIMRADNKGEGGVLSLAALALRAGHAAPMRRAIILI